MVFVVLVPVVLLIFFAFFFYRRTKKSLKKILHAHFFNHQNHVVNVDVDVINNHLCVDEEGKVGFPQKKLVFVGHKYFCYFFRKYAIRFRPKMMVIWASFSSVFCTLCIFINFLLAPFHFHSFCSKQKVSYNTLSWDYSWSKLVPNPFASISNNC